MSPHDNEKIGHEIQAIVPSISRGQIRAEGGLTHLGPRLLQPCDLSEPPCEAGLNSVLLKLSNV